MDKDTIPVEIKNSIHGKTITIRVPKVGYKWNVDRETFRSWAKKLCGIYKCYCFDNPKAGIAYHLFRCAIPHPYDSDLVTISLYEDEDFRIYVERVRLEKSKES